MTIPQILQTKKSLKTTNQNKWASKRKIAWIASKNFLNLWKNNWMSLILL